MSSAGHLHVCLVDRVAVGWGLLSGVPTCGFSAAWASSQQPAWFQGKPAREKREKEKKGDWKKERAHGSEGERERSWKSGIRSIIIPSEQLQPGKQPCILTSEFFKMSVLAYVNFMCQLGRATVPRYVVKHYFGCFCEDIFG